MELLGDILKAVVGIPILAAFALLVTWPALQVGIHAVRLASGRLEHRAPARQWWERNSEVVALLGIVSPIPDLIVNNAGSIHEIAGNPFTGVTSIGVVAGLVLGLAGIRRTTWAISAATAVVAVGLWLLLLAMPFLWTKAILAVIYTIAAAVTCFFYIRAFQLAGGANDELITDLGDPDVTARMRDGAKVLVSDGNILTVQPKAKVTAFVSGFLHKHLDFTALARDEGLYLRLLAPDAEMLKVDPGYPVRRRAFWFLIPWENLEVIKFDRIIGHTEIRLRLRHSGDEIVLEQPPKKIWKYLARLDTADGGQSLAATA